MRTKYKISGDMYIYISLIDMREPFVKVHGIPFTFSRLSLKRLNQIKEFLTPLIEEDKDSGGSLTPIFTKILSLSPAIVQSYIDKLNGVKIVPVFNKECFDEDTDKHQDYYSKNIQHSSYLCSDTAVSLN